MCYSILYADFITLHVNLLYNRVHRTQAVSKKANNKNNNGQKMMRGPIQSREE